MKTRKIQYEDIPWMNCKLVTSHRLQPDGYVRIRIEGHTYPIHRWIWIEAHGPIPNGLLVRHKCDNRDCINLDHLELGTHSDNTLDAVKRGRWPRQDGENNPQAKLTWNDIESIRASSLSAQELANHYFTTPRNVRKIRQGTRWPKRKNI